MTKNLSESKTVPTTISDTSIYNLKVVLQETGLKADTIRIWERRYGLPKPGRGDGGHRLYSRRDIESIKWLMARRGEGLSISSAVNLWNTLIAEGNDPLQPSSLPSAVPVAGEVDLAEAKEAWVAACMSYDEEHAEQVLNKALTAYTPEIVCLEVLTKGLSQLGQGWYLGNVTVQQEHFASELAMRRVEALLDTTPASSRVNRLLVAAPPGEEHDFNLLLLTLLLRRQGWDVVYLGSNVPLQYLDDTIATVHPHLVISSAQQLHTAAALSGVAQRLSIATIPLAFGGRIFNVLPALREHIPGYFLGENIEDVPEAISHIIEGLVVPARGAEISQAYRQAASHFRERLPLLEARVWQTAENLGLQHEHLSTANLGLARSIDAALMFGNMAFLDEGISWVRGLLTNHDIPVSMLDRYLATYHDAAVMVLDERAEPVVHWLAEFIKPGIPENK
jgi:methanogenic corrinoid protein MtbC1